MSNIEFLILPSSPVTTIKQHTLHFMGQVSERTENINWTLNIAAYTGLNSK